MKKLLCACELTLAALPIFPQGWLRFAAASDPTLRLRKLAEFAR